MVYQFFRKSQAEEGALAKVNLYFIATSLANMAWIFAWHYDYIGFSVLIMGVLLFCLIRIADTIRPLPIVGWEKKQFFYAGVCDINLIIMYERIRLFRLLILFCH